MFLYYVFNIMGLAWGWDRIVLSDDKVGIMMCGDDSVRITWGVV
jgi:hypothetical protein